MVGINDLANLPPHHEEAFLQFESLCRSEMHRWIDNMDDRQSWDQPRLEYMSKVYAAAHELGIDGAGELSDGSHSFVADDFNWFNQAVIRLTTRYQLRAVRRTAEDTIELEPEERTSIKAEIERLKNRVTKADELDDGRKSTLLRKLDDLLKEVEKPTLNLARFMLAMAAVTAAFTAVGTAQSAAIKGPQTVVAVLDMVHMAKGKDEQRRALFERYRKPPAIEDQAKTTPKSARAVSGFSTSLDDEIPF